MGRGSWEGAKNESSADVSNRGCRFATALIDPLAGATPELSQAGRWALQDIEPQHPPDKKYREGGAYDVNDPVASCLRLTKIEHAAMVAVPRGSPISNFPIPLQVFAAIVPEFVQISYPHHMDHLGVLRDKIGRLREEIAEIRELNEQFRSDGGDGAAAQVAHGQRNERLQAIQQELVQLADLGRRVISTEQMKEKHRSRLYLVKQKRAS
jgi:hypothetical protein